MNIYYQPDKMKHSRYDVIRNNKRFTSILQAMVEKAR